MATETPHRPAPHARPLILCHDVLPDPDTGNVHLIGVFDAIRPAAAPAYPHRHGEFCVFTQLSDAVGRVVGQIEITEPDSDEAIFLGDKHVLRFRDRRGVVRAVFRVRNCLFERPGVYLVRLYCNGYALADHPLRLLDVP